MHVDRRVLLAVGAAASLSTGCPPPAAEESLTLGVVVPYTGALGGDGQGIENALQLGVNEINEAGGLLGKQVRLEIRDSATDGETAKAAARELVDLGVPVIFGEDASGVTLAMAEVTTAAGVVQIAGSSTSPAITSFADDDFLFRTVVSDAFQGAVLAQALVDDGVATASILFTENVYGEGLAAVVEAEFEALGGQVLQTRSSPEGLPNDYDFQADLDVVFQGNPQAVVIVAYDTDAAQYLRTWNANGGFDGTWYLSDASKVEGLLANVGAEALEGVKGTAPVFGAGPSFAKFATAYEEAYGTAPDLFGDNFYDAAVLVGLAVAKAGAAEGAAIKGALRDVAAGGTAFGPDQVGAALQAIANGEDVDYQGASGPVDFDEAGDVAGSIEIWEVRSGAFAQVRVVEP